MVSSWGLRLRTTVGVDEHVVLRKWDLFSRLKFACSGEIKSLLLPLVRLFLSIKIEDIRIETDEDTIVNCINSLEKLLDESVVEESPRDIFLNLVRKINPRGFVQGTANGGHGMHFFISQFWEALFHYSAIFHMLDTTVPRDNPERILLEREMFGQKVMNVVACEGPERIDRPEIYEKWHLRNIRAGFVPLPLDRVIAGCYHKDFEIEEDRCWLLLQGWNGRIVHALSTWKPVTSS